MMAYCRLAPVNPVEDDTNMIYLRSDLHSLFDKRRFTFVPKRSSAGGVVLVIHVLRPQTFRELHHLYHNRALQPPTTGIAVQHLYARIAWSVLCDENYPFLRGSHQYSVQLFDPSLGNVSTKQLKSGDLMHFSHGFPRPVPTRSVSPRKRSAAEMAADDDELGEDEDDDDYDGGNHDEVEEDEGFRGRTRKRSSEYNEQHGDNTRDFLLAHQVHSSPSTRSPTSLETVREEISFVQDKSLLGGDERETCKSLDCQGLPGRKRRRVSPGLT